MVDDAGAALSPRNRTLLDRPSLNSAFGLGALERRFSLMDPALPLRCKEGLLLARPMTVGCCDESLLVKPRELPVRAMRNRSSRRIL